MCKFNCPMRCGHHLATKPLVQHLIGMETKQKYKISFYISNKMPFFPLPLVPSYFLHLRFLFSLSTFAVARPCVRLISSQRCGPRQDTPRPLTRLRAFHALNIPPRDHPDVYRGNLEPGKERVVGMAGISNHRLYLQSGYAKHSPVLQL